MAKSDNIIYKISINSLSNLLNKIKDLTKLDTRVLFVFDNTDLLLYSMVGNSNSVHGFKNHIMKMKDLFTTKSQLEEPIKFSITDAKKFIVSVSAFVKYMKNQNIDDDLTFKLTYNDENFVEKLLIQNKKSKEDIVGGDPSAFKQSIDIDTINELMDIDASEFSFVLKKDDYDYIKSKLAIDKTNDVLYLNIKDKKLIIGENRWEHTICDIESDDNTTSFPKKYFKCIDFGSSNEMTIYLFDRFILIMGENTNLMISVELTA
ncbi:hypothetical protein M0Q50_07735 [bacterium]|jgi:hypothetical protein|nr:hypothetical protein [bacterium]